MNPPIIRVDVSARVELSFTPDNLDGQTFGDVSRAATAGDRGLVRRLLLDAAYSASTAPEKCPHCSRFTGADVTMDLTEHDLEGLDVMVDYFLDRARERQEVDA